MEFDFDDLLKNYEDKEIEKDKFIELTKDRLSFLDTERKKAYQARDEKKAELKQLKESSNLDTIKEYFSKEIESLKDSKKQSKIESDLLKKEITELSKKYHAYNSSQIPALINVEGFIYDPENESFKKPILNESKEIISYKTLDEEVQQFLSDPKNDNLVLSSIKTSGLDIPNFQQGEYGKGKIYPQSVLEEADEKGLSPEDLIKINAIRDKKLSYRR